MNKIITRDFRYTIDYHYSYGELSPFFEGLSKKKLLGTRCGTCQKTYATPRLHCLECGKECRWLELPQKATVHSWTTCYYGSEEFLKQTPYHLILVQFPQVETLFLSQLKKVKEGTIKIGMSVKVQFKQKLKLKASDVYFIPS